MFFAQNGFFGFSAGWKTFQTVLFFHPHPGSGISVSFGWASGGSLLCPKGESFSPPKNSFQDLALFPHRIQAPLLKPTFFSSFLWHIFTLFSTKTVGCPAKLFRFFTFPQNKSFPLHFFFPAILNLFKGLKRKPPQTLPPAIFSADHPTKKPSARAPHKHIASKGTLGGGGGGPVLSATLPKAFR